MIPKNLILGVFVVLTLLFASISALEYFKPGEVSSQSSFTSTNSSVSFYVANEGAIPSSFLLGNGYRFTTSNTGPPPLPHSFETATEITIIVSQAQAIQNVSFIWAGTWSPYSLPSPTSATLLNGSVSFHWAKTSDNSGLILTIATS